MNDKQIVAPDECPTYRTTSGDHIICRRCGEGWPAGAISACTKAVRVLTSAGVINAAPVEPAATVAELPFRLVFAADFLSAYLGSEPAEVHRHLKTLIDALKSAP